MRPRTIAVPGAAAAIAFTSVPAQAGAAAEAAPSSEAQAVNNRGEVVGQSHLESLQLHAFIWSRGSMADVGTLN